MATAQTMSAPFTPIPSLADGLLTKYKRSKVLINQLSLFSISSSLKQSLWRGDEKQKDVFRHPFASFIFCGKEGIPAQLVQDSYLLYMCLILQIIRSTMGYQGKLSTFLPSQSSHNILSVSHRCNFLVAKMHQKSIYQNYPN